MTGPERSGGGGMTGPERSGGGGMTGPECIKAPVIGRSWLSGESA
jgi:hypothetical protein